MKKIRMPDEAYRSGAAFAVTIATHRRRRFLARPELAELCVHALKETTNQYDARVFAYCFMPDHAHLLVCVPNGSLLDFVRHFKQFSSFAAKALIGDLPLWETRFFDRALRSEDGLAIIARYILFNPVRAGLARHITDYTYGGSFVWPQLLTSGSEDPDLHLPHLRKFAIVLAD